MQKIEMKKKLKMQMRTWYGLNASVIIGPGFLHRAGWRGFLIPHPPIVNWLLRWGLRENERHSLSFTHEFGHFQSAPLALPYTAGMLAVPFATGRLSLSVIIMVFISTHAASEIMAEIITVMSDIQFYRKCYEKITIIPRIIFWFLMTALTIAGWIILL